LEHGADDALCDVMSCYGYDINTASAAAPTTNDAGISIYTQTFNGPLSGRTQMSRYQNNTVGSACKKTEWWGAGVVICLQRGADLHMAQLMLLPLIVSCFSKIQIGFTFPVPA